MTSIKLALIATILLATAIYSPTSLANKNKRDMVVKVKYFEDKFLQAKDKDTTRGNGGADNIEGDGFAFVESNCDGPDNKNNVCNIVIEFRFRPLLDKFEHIAIHFFDDATKSPENTYGIVKSAKYKGCGNQPDPEIVDDWLVKAKVKSSCHKLVVKLSGRRIADTIDSRMGVDDMSSGSNIFYVIEAKKQAGVQPRCLLLSAPFEPAFQNGSCSTADPVLIVRRRGIL